jgi:hypothetical protein
VREAAIAFGDANPVGHHVTNIVTTPVDARSARVRSKGIGIKADGTAGSVVYDDVVVTRQPEQEVIGTSASTGEFALPNIVVLTARNGQITRLRDYVSIPAAAAAMGRDI